MKFRLYTEATAKIEVTLDTLDHLIDLLEYDRSVQLLASGQAVEFNNFLHSSKEDSGLSAVDGSTRVNDNTLAYFGHDRQPQGEEAKAFDWILKVTDTDDVTTVSNHRKGSFMYERLLMTMFGGTLSNDTLADLERADNANG